MATPEKVQVVFLVNTEAPNGSSADQHCKTLCLACTRILMTRFPIKEHSQGLQWNYKFFSTETPLRGVVSTAEFFDVRSELLTHFFDELQLHLGDDNSDGPSRSVVLRRQSSWAQSVYSALAASVQDFIWDAPEIKSPIRPRQQQQQQQQERGRRGKTKSRLSANPPPSPPRNIIFLFIDGPDSSSNTTSGSSGSSGTGDVGGDAPTAVVNQMLPKPLLSQLFLKGISVCWVYDDSKTGGCAFRPRDFVAAFQEVGGRMVPISRILDLTNQSTLLPRLLSNHVSAEVSARPCFGRNLFWFCFGDGKVVCTLELHKNASSNNSRDCDSTAAATKQQKMATAAGPEGVASATSEEAGVTVAMPHRSNSSRKRIVLGLGVVSQCSVFHDLHLLDLSTTSSCSGLCVPTSTSLDVRGHTSLPPPPQNLHSSTPPPPTTTTKSPSPQPPSTPHSTPTRPDFHRSPQIHLYRSPHRLKRGVSTSVSDLLNVTAKESEKLQQCDPPGDSAGFFPEPVPLREEEESKRSPSEQFGNLCSWLAANRLLLVCCCCCC